MACPLLRWDSHPRDVAHVHPSPAMLALPMIQPASLYSHSAMLLSVKAMRGEKGGQSHFFPNGSIIPERTVSRLFSGADWKHTYRKFNQACWGLGEEQAAFPSKPLPVLGDGT